MKPRAQITAAAVILAAVLLTACGERTKTVTQPASTAPLGRTIGGATPPRQAGGTSARKAAHAFFQSYLEISYGQRRPDQLRRASDSLRRSLRAQNARVPPGVRNLHPQVTALRLTPAGNGRLHAAATVEDGDVTPYPIFATLARDRSGAWVATSLGD